MNRQIKRWTSAELALLASHYETHTAVQLAALLGRSAKCVSAKLCRLGLHKAINPGGFKPGHGRLRRTYGPLQPTGRQALYFGPGPRPERQAKEGDTRLTKDRGQVPIWLLRVGGQWVRHHRHRWEQLHGPLPAGHVLRCRSTDTLNTDPANWEAISRAELALRNNGYVDLSDRYVARMLTTTGGKCGIGRIDAGVLQVVLTMPELLSAKRTHLQLNRALTLPTP